MNRTLKMLVVMILILAAGILIAIKTDRNGDMVFEGQLIFDKEIPVLLELGSDKCVPCKMMKPILEELTTEYGDKFKIVFIDVWKNQDQGRKYGIDMIPTQIFFDSEGKELFRHQGFYSRDAILAKWKELGVDL